MIAMAVGLSVGTNSDQRCPSGGQVPRACHSSMRGTRCASASTTVIAYSAIVAACTPLAVARGIALCV